MYCGQYAYKDDRLNVSCSHVVRCTT